MEKGGKLLGNEKAGKRGGLAIYLRAKRTCFSVTTTNAFGNLSEKCSKSRERTRILAAGLSSSSLSKITPLWW
jgi:hypothetical protein